jgi:hypothetical protein
LTIFGNNLAFFSKTNVMIKSLKNLALFSVKNANFFADFFGKNISKIITSVLGRALQAPEQSFVSRAGIRTPCRGSLGSV